jgi:hypothetical protein
LVLNGFHYHGFLLLLHINSRNIFSIFVKQFIELLIFSMLKSLNEALYKYCINIDLH